MVDTNVDRQQYLVVSIVSSGTTWKEMFVFIWFDDGRLNLSSHSLSKTTISCASLVTFRLAFLFEEITQMTFLIIFQ